jgi:hypothetical protein
VAGAIGWEGREEGPEIAEDDLGQYRHCPWAQPGLAIQPPKDDIRRAWRSRGNLRELRELRVRRELVQQRVHLGDRDRRARCLWYLVSDGRMTRASAHAFQHGVRHDIAQAS